MQTENFVEFPRPAGFWRRSLEYSLDVSIVGLFNQMIFAHFIIPKFFLDDIQNVLRRLSDIVSEGNLSSTAAINPLILTLAKLFTISAAITFVLFNILYAIYLFVCRASIGRSVGRVFTEMDVTNYPDGSPVPFSTIVWRDTIGRFLSGIVLWIGFLFPLFRADKRALHDLIFKTQMRESANDLSMSRWIFGSVLILILMMVSAMMMPKLNFDSLPQFALISP